MSNDNWGTPRWLFDEINKEFGFTLDVCASAENHKVHKFWTEAEDGLKQVWDRTNWCNPPYSDQLPWIRMAIEVSRLGGTTVMLLMWDTSTHASMLVMSAATEVRLINHRIQFDGAPGPARFANAIAIFRPRPVWQIFHPPCVVVPADYRYAIPKRAA